MGHFQVADGSVFEIVAKDTQYCLAVREAGWTKVFKSSDPEVYLAARDGSSGQQWRLVAGNSLQHVESGQFLETHVKYLFMKNAHRPWDGTGSPLVTPRLPVPDTAYCTDTGN